MNDRILLLIALVASGCAKTSESATSGPGGATTSPEQPSPTPTAQSEASAAPASSVALERRHHDASMLEVSPSPDGFAALTLDTTGAVRLWTSYDGAVPFVLPVEEPVWMSLAATGGGYLAAFVDTSGGVHVGRIAIEGGTGRWTDAFEAPPMDPMFELHVLEGGERILALGVDHRVRLWDAAGHTLAELDEPGVIPWQLRVQHGASGTHAAVVQFAPVRIQRLSISDAGLSLKGEPQTVAIDQSPNRNDIALSEDGRYVTAMQKPEANSGRFEVEIIDLEEGTRRMLVAESDEKFRPRIHALADAVIAETGSGAGMRLPLELAVPWQADMERAALSPILAEPVSVSASDEDSRNHAVVRGGIRAVAWGDALHVQPIGGGDAMRVAQVPFDVGAVGLDADGGRVVWGDAAGLYVEPIDGADAPRALSGTAEPAELLAFSGDDRLVTLDAKGNATLRELSSDAVLDTATIPISWGIEHSGWRAGASGGVVVVASSKPGSPLQMLTVRGDALGEPSSVDLEHRVDWPEGGKPRGTDSAAWMSAQGFNLSALGLRRKEVMATLPDPTRTGSVVVQFHRSEADWGAAHLTKVEGEARVWVHDAKGLRDTAWSGDATRFAYVDASGGHVCDGETGAVVLERRWRPVVAS